MSILEHLEPKGVFRFFEELCAIPHGSGNTKAISDWLMDFAHQRNLEAYQDSMNNVIIIKEAAPGYESAAPVILQGHVDMVCEKAPDCEKDMETEGLDLVVEGDTVYARGTTLGGDDGIAVAMALAILDDDGIPHPRLEAVFTVDEEIGMLGAVGMEDVSMLKGRRMLNLDSEVEGVFTVSCAGGNVTRCTLPVERAPYAGKALTITVGGLQGGHSGVEIDKGLGNANMLLGRVLYAVSQQTELRLAEVRGGLKDNAIPRESSATVVTDAPDAVFAVCRRLDEQLKNEYRATDAAVFVSAAESGSDTVPMDKASTQRILCFLTCAPNGIQAMSADIAGLVQTSLNLGVLTTEASAVSASFCVRSSVESQKQMLVERLTCLTETFGGSTAVFGDYSGWEYLPDSPLRELLVEVFTEQYGHAPKIEAIHAGVECGIFSGKLPGLDCVSMGPDLTEIHTCRERLHIASTQRLWAMVLETLKRMK
jgi:dipeptidase D